MTLYYEDDDYYYVDPHGDLIMQLVNKKLSVGDLSGGGKQLMPGSQIGQKGSLQGVYNINKGYTQFRQINILAQNEEYTLGGRRNQLRSDRL